ncbi:MAG: thiolase domain-containing protein, partial [Candidatus Korarchaeota archaeon]|nr:thiolase domain-containing protein [Candidatus Korarchaeota archaeon]
TSAAANEILMAAGAPEEIGVGLPFFASYALMARAYMEKYGASEEDLALVAVKNHENALRNPLAQFKRTITVEDVMRTPYVAPPLKPYDCSPLSDGAAAVILGGEPRRYTDTPVYIAGAGMAHDKPGVFERDDMTAMIAARRASEQAYRAAGISPRNLDLAEVHDAFTISEIILYEMLGFAERGGGARLLRERETWLEGSLPVNPSGGLKAKGHPIGATGIGMAAELFWQLRGESGERQVRDAETGLMENHGGTGATSVVMVMRR